MSNTATIASDYQESIESYRQLIASTGEDLHRPGLEDTPTRAAKAFAHLTKGYHQSLDEVVNDALFPSTNRELVLVQNIEFYSLCEHHMLPFHGVAHIGYLPNGQVLGLSKFARIVDMFARRLQVQERLTNQIAEAIQENLEPKGVAVWVNARHLCIESRGVRNQNSATDSLALRGVFKEDPRTRSEFLAVARSKV